MNCVRTSKSNITSIPSNTYTLITLSYTRQENLDHLNCKIAAFSSFNHQQTKSLMPNNKMFLRQTPVRKISLLSIISVTKYHPLFINQATKISSQFIIYLTKISLLFIIIPAKITDIYSHINKQQKSVIYLITTLLQS